MQLHSVLERVIDHRGRTPGKLGGDFVDSGVQVISAINMKGGRLDLGESTKFVTRRMYDQWMPEKLKAGDVLLTSEAPLGEVAFLAHESEYCLGQRLFALRADRRQVYPRFLYYLLRSSDVQQRLRARATGTTAQGIRQSELLKVDVELPGLPEQRRIAHILGTLDDKIELNRRMNRTLEETARAVFRSWFVDFNPVRAKAAGRAPEGMDAATAALFPNNFQPGASGLVPAGWTVRPLEAITSYLNRGISPTYVDSGGVLVVNQKCVRDHQVDYAKARRHNEMVRRVDGRLLEPGDVLVNSTGVGTLGRIAQVLALPEPTVVDSHVTVVRANGVDATSEYLGQLLLSIELEIEGLGEGSTGQTELSRKRLSELMVLVPPPAIAQAFSRICRPLLRKTAVNAAESGMVVVIRDTLLPKLLSGEVRIEDAGVGARKAECETVEAVIPVARS